MQQEEVMRQIDTPEGIALAMLAIFAMVLAILKIGQAMFDLLKAFKWHKKVKSTTNLSPIRVTSKEVSYVLDLCFKHDNTLKQMKEKTKLPIKTIMNILCRYTKTR